MSLFSLWAWFVAVPQIGKWAPVFGGAAAFIVFVAFMFYMCTNTNYWDDDEGKASKAEDRKNVPWMLKLSGVFLVLALLTSLMPNEKQAMLLAGGYAVANNEEIAKMPTNVAKAANAYLEEIYNEMKEDEAPTEPARSSKAQ